MNHRVSPTVHTPTECPGIHAVKNFWYVVLDVHTNILILAAKQSFTEVAEMERTSLPGTTGTHESWLL
jgi:hypothetical protein